MCWISVTQHLALPGTCHDDGDMGLGSFSTSFMCAKMLHKYYLTTKRLIIYDRKFRLCYTELSNHGCYFNANNRKLRAGALV